MTRDEAEKEYWFIQNFAWCAFWLGMVVPCVCMVVGLGVFIYLKEFQ